MDRSIRLCGLRPLLFVVGFGVASAMSATPAQAQQLCGGVDYPFPYTDVSAVGAAFCPGIMEAYVTGVTKGTSPTTFSPDEAVPRLQMTTFLQRSLDQGLTRANRKAALQQWWTPQNSNGLQTISVGGDPFNCAADGKDIWIAAYGTVVQVQANTGAVLGTWTGATHSYGVLVAAGKVFVTGQGRGTPSNLYVIDPTQAPGVVTTTVPNILGVFADGIAFDGTNLWTANGGAPGSVSIIEPQPPYTATTVFSAGFPSPVGILYDGAHIWVTDQSLGTLSQLDASGSIVKTVTVGSSPQAPVFDGTNIWVPNQSSNSISVVQASSGNVVATINANASNLLSSPTAASFDGERVLVTNLGNSTVTLFKAADLSFIANVSTGAGTGPYGACSDRINFWVPVLGTSNLLRL